MGKIKWHIFVLLGYSSWGMLLDLYAYGNDIRVPLSFDVLLRQYWIVYTGFAILYFLFLGKKKYILYSIPILIVSFLGTYFFTSLYEKIHNILYEKVNYTPKQMISSVVETYSHFFIVSIGLFFFIRYNLKQKENLTLIEKNLTLQKNLFQSENDFLRAQINPHFLHNCLNYFYAETMAVAPNVGDGIMLLSKIMRYSITDFTATNGLAKLDDELLNIDNVIQINKFRFNNALYIKFNIEGNATEKYITPMILISLVENMFKHGDLQDETSPAYINCSIDETTQTVNFVTSNKCNKSNVVIPGGLGTGNIIKRLELLYGNNYTLAFEEQVSVYTSKLVIPFYNTYIK